MTHALQDKQKLLNRVRRLRGQVDAIERAIETGTECGEVMRLLTAARGAINSVMAEVVTDHVRSHMVDEDRRPSRREQEAADDLLDVLKTYIR